MTLVGAALPRRGADDAQRGINDDHALFWHVRYAAPGRRGKCDDRCRIQLYSALCNPAKGFVGYSNVSFDAGAIKPERAFYAGLKALLGCDASELLMLFNMWRDDSDGAVEAGSRLAGRSLGPCFSSRQFMAVR